METTRTGWHRWLEKKLHHMGLSYVSEYTEFWPYSLDLYLPEWHLCIEVDGPYHRRKADALRDDQLMRRYQIPTLRLSSKTGLHREHLETIIHFIEEHADSVEERMEAWRLN